MVPGRQLIYGPPPNLCIGSWNFLGQNHVIRTFFDMATHGTELIPKGLLCNRGLLDINFVIQGP